MRAVLRPITNSRLRRSRFPALILAGALLAPGVALPQVDLGTTINGNTGFNIIGAEVGIDSPGPGTQGDQSGSSVSGAGDFNGDGLADIILGAYTADGPSNARPDAGEAFLLLGEKTNSAVFRDLAGFGAGEGALFQGAFDNDLTGKSVAGVGDFNGDGYDDILIGAFFGDGPGDTRADAGDCYLIYGSANPLPSPVDLASLPPTVTGFVIHGASAGDTLGRGMSSADVNGDGLMDLLIAASGGDGPADVRPNCGEVYVIYGTSAAMGPSFDLTSINGTNGTVIYGIETLDMLAGAAVGSDWGNSPVSGIADMNGDGISDILIGAHRADGPVNGRADAGDCYVVFGNTAGLGASFDLTSINGTNGFGIFGAEAGDRTGFSVAGTGDVNGDGYGDIVIGAWQGDGPANADASAGDSYLIFGKGTGFASTLDLATMVSPAGLTMLGTDAADRGGWNVGGPGDINGDGFMEVLVGAYLADGAANARSNSGENYMLFGKSAAYPTSIDLATFAPADGTIYFGAGGADWSGFFTSAAGDRNGDGASDFMTSAMFADGQENSRLQCGETHFVFGTAPSSFATYRGYAPAGDASRIPVGSTGSGATESFPGSRCWIDFASGSGTSLQIVSLTRSGSSITGMVSPADVLWQVSSDRVGWSSADITFRYTDDEIGDFYEPGLQVWQAAAPTGPWNALATTVDPDRNLITGQTDSLGFFAISEDFIPPSVYELTLRSSNEDEDYASWDVKVTEALSTPLTVDDLTDTGDVTSTFSVEPNPNGVDYVVYMNFSDPEESGSASFSIANTLTDAAGNGIDGTLSSSAKTVVNYQDGDVNKDGNFDLADVALTADVNLSLATFP